MLEALEAILDPERDVLIQGAEQSVVMTAAMAMFSCRHVTWTDADPWMHTNYETCYSKPKQWRFKCMCMCVCVSTVHANSLLRQEEHRESMAGGLSMALQWWAAWLGWRSCRKCGLKMCSFTLGNFDALGETIYGSAKNNLEIKLQYIANHQKLDNISQTFCCPALDCLLYIEAWFPSWFWQIGNQASIYSKPSRAGQHKSNLLLSSSWWFAIYWSLISKLILAEP